VCWQGYLSEVRCRVAYGPADPSATYCLLLQEIQIGFGFTTLVVAHSGSPGQNPESSKMVVVVVIDVPGRASGIKMVGMAELGAPISQDGVAVHPDSWCICPCYPPLHQNFTANYAYGM